MTDIERPMRIIARIKTDFPEKFGIPRQSGILHMLEATVVFEPEYRNPDALRGVEGFSHLWLVWKFSEAVTEEWSPTVRPPRLGGNVRKGVFATRSPFRPNPIGLSSVRLLRVEEGKNGKELVVSGADLMDGTPIYDIKPYLAFSDSHPDAIGGFSDEHLSDALAVSFPEDLKSDFPPEKMDALVEILKQDPRPSYQDDPDRIYGFLFAGFEIRFRVCDGHLTVCSIERA